MNDEEVRKKFIELSQLLHPDATASTNLDAFLQLKEEYDSIRAINKSWKDIEEYFANQKIDWLALVKNNSDFIIDLIAKFKKKN